MKRYFIMVRAYIPGIETHLRITSGSLSINVVSSDSGGEFTTKYGGPRGRDSTSSLNRWSIA